MKKNVNELLTPEVTKELDSMIKKIAYKKRNTVVIEFEDLVSELWLKALSVIEKYGKVDFDLIAKACFFGIVDIVRSNVKTNATPYANQMFDYCITREQFQNTSANHHEGTIYEFSTIQGNRFEKAQERIEIQEILDLFDSETEEKERLYVKTWIEITGLDEDIENPEELPEKAYERFIAVDKLGYAGSGSGGYLRLKRRVRARLIEAGYKL